MTNEELFNLPTLEFIDDLRKLGWLRRPELEKNGDRVWEKPNGELQVFSKGQPEALWLRKPPRR